MIAVRNIVKSFGSVMAVDGLSFSVQQGEIVGLLGPNGAGKTTTMRMMTGFLSPDLGTVTVDDINIATDSIAAQSHIGYLPENNPLYKDMLVSEFLSFVANARSLQGEKRRECMDFAVKSTTISDVFYRPIGELSKGYKQRVGMAAAILHRPDVLIMDEPTEGLDPNQRNEVRHLIKKLAKDHTIILSTHVMQEVEAVCERIIIINRGKLVADGTPEKLRSGIKGTGVIVTLEGTSVIAELKSVKGVKSVETIGKSGNKLDIRIVTETKTKIQPELTRLAGKHKWTIWKLTEEQQNLEEVFQKLTRGD
ncbi:ATP-binding cassette domain-containing protein [Candidatus Roizmanbacteria bacterium]|nr:ATP-binding cassette domain-containing protein [Candidatus Roizmanbacteria bacterium]